MSKLHIEQVIDVIHKLPSLPSVVLDLLASLEQENINTHQLSEKISRDQALAAKTLKVANSSFYGMSHQISSVNDAISILGFHTIRNITVTSALIAGLASDGASKTVFWRHSIATAVCARALAAQTGCNKESAYSAGLLHDIGQLLLATQFPDTYAEVLQFRKKVDCQLFEAEQEILGLDHALVGDTLAQRWKFPANIQTAISNHHTPSNADTLAQVIHLADAFAHALGFATTDDDLVPHIYNDAMEGLGLSDHSILLVFKDACRDFEGASMSLPH